jgi:hypothetical protein
MVKVDEGSGYTDDRSMEPVIRAVVQKFLLENGVSQMGAVPDQ